MDTMRYAVYNPPKKGLPYLAVGMIGDNVECLLAADTRVEALEKLDMELEVLRTKSRLFEKYASDLSAEYELEDLQTTASVSTSTS